MFKCLIVLLFGAFSALGQVCGQYLETLPVQAAGRVKPLYVHANESVKFITGKSKVNGQNALDIFCQLSLSSLGKGQDIELPLKVEHIEAKELLNMEPGANSLPASEASQYKELIRSKLMGMKQSTPLKKELNKVWSRINAYEMIKNGQSWSVPIFSEGEVLWHGIKDVAADKDREELRPWLLDQKEEYIELKGDRFLLELTYVKSHVFDIAMLLSLIGIFATVLRKRIG
ncbi:MAG: hypothetical protein WEB87_05155, partial [Bacteriovoracaceae bacterium]